MQLFIAIVGTVTTVITVTLTNFFAKRNQIKLEERKIKEQYYIKFIEAISNNVLNEANSVKARNELCDAQNQLILVGSTEVVDNLMRFHDLIKPSTIEFSGQKHDELLTKLIKSMRKDLYGNKVNENYPTIHLSGITSYGRSKNMQTH